MKGDCRDLPHDKPITERGFFRLFSHYNVFLFIFCMPGYGEGKNMMVLLSAAKVFTAFTLPANF